MVIRVEYEALNNINYVNNYDKIFENNNLVFNLKILTVKILEINSYNESFNKIDYRN